MATRAALGKAWDDVRSMRPIIEAHRGDGEILRRLPDPIYDAFVERDIYRLTLPEYLSGLGLDPVEHFDLTLEVSRYDGSAGWLYWLGGGAAALAGKLPENVSREVFESPECGGAGAGAPTGRAVAEEGGYRVNGRWAWASGIHHARFVTGNCIVFDGERPRLNEQGGPTIMMALFPRDQIEILDTWDTGGMRGTGSTEFIVKDRFIPEERLFAFFGPSTFDDPAFNLPISFFGFGLVAVALGIAYSAVDALTSLAADKKLPPPRTVMADQSSTQFTVAKVQAMLEAVHLGARHAGELLWQDVCNDTVSMAGRARLRRALTHAVDTCVEAVGMCFREAGGSAVFKSAPFEKALRDIYTIGGHAVVQRAMMEDAGRVMLGREPILGMF